MEHLRRGSAFGKMLYGATFTRHAARKCRASARGLDGLADQMVLSTTLRARRNLGRFGGKGCSKRRALPRGCAAQTCHHKRGYAKKNLGEKLGVETGGGGTGAREPAWGGRRQRKGRRNTRRRPLCREPVPTSGCLLWVGGELLCARSILCLSSSSDSAAGSPSQGRGTADGGDRGAHSIPPTPATPYHDRDHCSGPGRGRAGEGGPPRSTNKEPAAAAAPKREKRVMHGPQLGRDAGWGRTRVLQGADVPPAPHGSANRRRRREGRHAGSWTDR
jgi:hypothetical protein